MRRDVAADLEHDLAVRRQRNRADAARPRAAANPGANGAAEAGKAARREPLPPDREEVSGRQLRGRDAVDDTGRRFGTQRIAAACPRRNADTRRQQQRAFVGEELDVRLDRRRLPAHTVEPSDCSAGLNPPRRGGKLVAGPAADRRRNRRAGDTGSTRGEDCEGTHVACRVRRRLLVGPWAEGLASKPAREGESCSSIRALPWWSYCWRSAWRSRQGLRRP